MSGRQAKAERRARGRFESRPHSHGLRPSQEEAELAARMRRASDQALAMFYRDREPYEVNQRDAGLFQTLYPMACHAIEQVRAATLLTDAGFSYAAEVNARAAFQHAVTAQWMLLTRNSEEAVVVEIRAQLDRHIAAFNRIFDQSIPAVGLDPELERQHAAGNFKAMCDRYSPDGSLYLVFQHLSGSVHPSLATVTKHYAINADGDALVQEGRPPTLQRDSDPHPSLDLLMAMAMSAVFAVNALETIRKGQPRLVQITGIARWNQVPPSLAADETQPQLARLPIASPISTASSEREQQSTEPGIASGIETPPT